MNEVLRATPVLDLGRYATSRLLPLATYNVLAHVRSSLPADWASSATGVVDNPARRGYYTAEQGEIENSHSTLHTVLQPAA